MKKLLLPLLLFAVSGLTAELPVVKSKAAQELLKHPEFKKALEAAPEFTKAVLKELDKYAPKTKNGIDESYGIRPAYGGEYVGIDVEEYQKKMKRLLMGKSAKGVVALLGKPVEVSSLGFFKYRVLFEDSVTGAKYRTLQLQLSERRGQKEVVGVKVTQYFVSGK